MNYQSTRDSDRSVSACAAMLQGLSPDGGLFVPESVPQLFSSAEEWLPLGYSQRAARVLEAFLPEFSQEEIKHCLEAAYSTFDHPAVAPLVSLEDGLFMLELWHGPTCAFKDMALQLFPRLLVEARKKSGDGGRILILVATSGDTGKAALEGFRDVPGIEIAVFYPEHGTSELQRLQMVTQQGGNVHVFGVQGNFDDAQRGVKIMMNDHALISKMAEKGLTFSSANSINWGRLLPQICYYFSAYADMVAAKGLSWGEQINVCVPTGNFGNILAAYIAKLAGLPIKKLICASNANDVLTEFIRTGRYDRNRPFYRTASPSMDILVSSNLERLLYLLSGRDSAQVTQWMKALNDTGVYQVNDDLLKIIQESFYAGSADDAQTDAALSEIYTNYHYLSDPHTAVGYKVVRDYQAETGDQTPMLVVSTASPFKFPADVARALGAAAEGDEFALNRALSALSGLSIPVGLSGLDTLPVLHGQVCAPDAMTATIENIAKV